MREALIPFAAGSLIEETVEAQADVFESVWSTSA